MAKIGYARVSSKSQDYQGQMAALKAAGCEKIYSEKVSGKNTKDRREFNKLMKALLPGDTVYVAKLDRLARSPATWPTSCTILMRGAVASSASARAGATPRPRLAGCWSRS